MKISDLGNGFVNFYTQTKNSLNQKKEGLSAKIGDAKTRILSLYEAVNTQRKHLFSTTPPVNEELKKVIAQFKNPKGKDPSEVAMHPPLPLAIKAKDLNLYAKECNQQFKEELGKELETILRDKEVIDDKGNVIDRGPRWVDTSNEFKVSVFGKNAYNGPKVSDFVNRQELLHQAALKHINSYIASHGIESLLQELLENYQTKLENLPLDEGIMRGGDFAAAEKHFKTIHKQAEKLLAQYARDLTEVMNSDLVGGSPEPFTLEHLQKLEKECVEERGRPTIINIYEVEEVRFLSIQQPGNQKVIPSSIRSKEGLCNYVTTTFAKVKDDGTVDILSHGVRHSDYPPIAIKDPLKRRKIAAENCKQGLIDDAARLYGKATLKEGDTLQVPKRVMILLTAKRGDFARNTSFLGLFGKWRGESETTQLKESAEALSMWHGQTIETVINGVNVKIVPSISFMNLGTNEQAANLGFLGKLPTAPIQKRINAKGSEEFFQESMDFFTSQIAGLTRDKKELVKCYHEYQKALTNPAIERAKDHLEEKLAKFSPRLKAAYAELYTAQQPDGDKADIKKLTNEIASYEKKIGKAFVSLEKARAAHYKKNRREIAMREGVVLQHLQDDKALTAFCLSITKAQELYYNQRYKKPATVSEFQTHYLQLHMMMDNVDTYFCKSAEDRTGRENDQIEEREIFRCLRGHYPIYQDDFNFINSTIAPRVNQFSASRENTLQNSAAEGLQIGSRVNPASILPASNKRSAQMAKRVISEAAKCQPSEEVMDLIRDKPGKEP